MKLESITAKVKPRLGWEALDLGFRMVHHHWRSLYGIWFCLTFPPFLLAIILFPEQLVWVLIIFWWLKPLFDSALLNYISRALFGEYPTLKQTLKQFHRYAFKQFFSNLLWRRFSPTRSMDMAVSQLERLSGTRRSQRIRTLHAFNSGAASWLTFLFLLLHLLFYFNIVILCLWFVPDIYLEEVGEYFWDFIWASDSQMGQVIQILVMYSIIGLFSPFYVVCGFSIYINQRTILEAWDIELVFRKLAQRTMAQNKKSKRQKILGQLCIPFFALSMALTGSDGLLASEAEKPLTHDSAKQQIEAIFSKQPFKNEVKEEKLWFNFDFEEQEKEEDTASSNSGFGSLFGAFASLAEVVLWALVIGLVVWLIVKLVQLSPMFVNSRQKKAKKSAPDVLFGLQMSPESLPDNPAERALELWQTGQHRVAMSLLLRATLQRLITEHQCDFEDGNTELECAQIVSHTTARAISQYFTQLIHHWRLFAYGHKLPPDDSVVQLCQQWNKVFQPVEPNAAKEPV